MHILGLTGGMACGKSTFVLWFQLAILAAGEPVAADIPTKGLVAYYPFDGSSEDISGNGYHLNASGTRLVEDKFGNPLSAYFFGGERDYMTAPVNISPSKMPQITMVVWARAEQEDRIGTIFSNASGGSRMRTLSMRPSLDRGGFWATNTRAYGSWAWEKLETGRWTFLAISYDQFLQKLYLQVDDRRFEADCTQVDGRVELTIGKNPRQGEFFHGYLDEIRIYDRVLDGDEIAALYRQFQRGKGEEATRNGGRRGLMWVFVSGFSLFAVIVLGANVMIRRT